MNESMKKLIEIMDLNTILNMYIDPIKNGITFLTNDILILTTFIIIFDAILYNDEIPFPFFNYFFESSIFSKTA